MDLLLLDGDGFGRTESNWKNIEIEENLIKLKNGGMEKQSPSRHLSKMKFIADGMCGGLARWLRLIGYDTLYFNTPRKIEIIRTAEREKRIVLTKDKKLVENYPEIVFYIEGENTEKQFEEVVKKFNLEIKEENLFKICSICNTTLENIEKEKVKNLVPEYVFNTKEEFAICRKCNKIYWEGDHCRYIREKLKKLF